MTQRRKLTSRHAASRDAFLHDLAAARGTAEQVAAACDYLRGALTRVHHTHPSIAADAAGRAVAALSTVTDELYATARRQ